MFKRLTKKERENIQFDEGYVVANFGLADEMPLSPTRGGCSFNVNETLKLIERDGQIAPEKGLQRVVYIEARMKVTVLSTAVEKLKLLLHAAETEGADDDLIIKNTHGGIVDDDDYIKNIVCFCQTLGGKYRKITLYNGLADNGLAMEAKPQDETTTELDILGHLDPSAEGEIKTGDLYVIENVTSLSSRTVLTVTSVAGATAGKTKLTVLPTPLAGNSLKTKTGASVPLPVIGGSTLVGYDTWNGMVDITATTGHTIVVVEVDTAGLVVGVGSATVTSQA